MNKQLFFILFILFTCISIDAQNIQWATSVLSSTHISDNTEHDKSQILGKPNAIQGAPSSGTIELTDFNTVGSVELSFYSPHQVQTVVIIENYLPGRVTKVVLKDIKGKKMEVYRSEPEVLVPKVNWLFIKVPLTDTKIESLTLHFSSHNTTEMPQIDAVGISRTADIPLLRREILSLNLPSAGNNPDLKIRTGREHLGSIVNDEAAEYYPIVTADGSTLFFNRKNFYLNKKRKQDKGDNYISNALADQFTKDRNFGDLNTKGFDRILSIGSDGGTFLISGTTPNSERGMLVTNRRNDGWTTPIPMSISGLEFDGLFMDAALSPSGNQLILSFIPEGGGDKNLYVSFKKSDFSWSAPILLKGVNSEHDDFAPFLASDGKTLYFSSKGFSPIGGSDIYVSRRLDDTYRNWSEPENLGTAVNTAGNEEYFTVTAKGDYGYFTSDMNSYKRKNDIFRILLNANYKPEPVVLMTGRIFDNDSEGPIDASLILSDMESGAETDRYKNTLSNGHYQFILPVGKYYDFTAEAEGYLASNENLDLRNINYFREIRHNLRLYPKEVGEVIPFNNIFFEEATANILPISKAEINRLIKMMRDNPTLVIELGGHTDNRGSFENKLQLSEQRVIAVKNVLVKAGISSERITTVGYGDKKPIAPNDSEENMAKNRRVEVKILAI
ncbi:OmpA family protein [Marinigracilibium pacificum]|uniref:OmpA family protein n=1 Tax=Marinigracilibium pacificum TaxID=2729599 RepID=A0A848J1F6_9BACT|nr:OmpA family protein [Marinigracilibium pacificum]NMM50643.1 OmpA family protein [Marinigracilibium pacificum]